MDKPRIYVTRKIPKEILEPYKDRFHFKMWEREKSPVPRDVLLEEGNKADGIVSMLTEKIDKAFLEHTSSLKIIANMAVGYDNIDLAATLKRNIVVTNTPGVLSETTADLTFALLMATARRIVEASNFIRNDKWSDWSPFFFAGSDIHHKTIGIVGMGSIGEAVARRAKGFGMCILYHNRNRKYAAEEELQAEYVNFDELIERSDYVVSLVPLTEDTKHLFNQEVFEKMKSSSIFINVSRGPVVDEDALYEALQAKQIKAAGLDVFESEPIRAEHPLLVLDNVVCLPHIGSASIETRINMLRLCLDNVEGYFYGVGPKTPVR